MFTRAIVRPPAPNFAQGLTTAGLGPPYYERALEQHEAYCVALERCGLTLTRLDPDPAYPDSCFVEDVAVMTDATAPLAAILTRPGAQSRLGEVNEVRDIFDELGLSVEEIKPPGTLDGGDVCQAGDHYFIGVSRRTNEAGAQQLANLLSNSGFTASLVDIRDMQILHLKSGLTYLGNSHLVVIDALADRSELKGYDLVRVDSPEEYAANCVRVNDYVLVAAGFPKFEARLGGLGIKTIVLEMSEFQKMDGGLSCLSLRF